MKRNILTSVMVMLLCLILTVPVMAQENTDSIRLADEADLLTETEEADLAGKLDEISERQQFDVVIVAVDSFEGQSAKEFAADYYDYQGYGYGTERDGILFLVGMEEREWFILTTGFGITAVSDYDIEVMSEKILPYLSDGDYALAFEIFAEESDALVTEAKLMPIEEEAEDEYTSSYYEDYEEEETSPGIISSIILGAVLAFFPVLAMKGQLKSVASKKEASSYVKEGSQKINVHRDTFLYHTIHRVERPKESSSNRSGSGSHTFRSSSGRSHGGGGGSF